MHLERHLSKEWNWYRRLVHNLNSLQTFESTQEDSKPTQRRGNIDTGRSGGISGAISAFNQVQSPPSETPTQRVIKHLKLTSQLLDTYDICSIIRNRQLNCPKNLK